MWGIPAHLKHDGFHLEYIMTYRYRFGGKYSNGIIDTNTDWVYDVYIVTDSGKNKENVRLDDASVVWVDKNSEADDNYGSTPLGALMTSIFSSGPTAGTCREDWKFIAYELYNRDSLVYRGSKPLSFESKKYSWTDLHGLLMKISDGLNHPEELQRSQGYSLEECRKIMSSLNELREYKINN